jgi:Family of unknown function (DUF6446)
MSGKVIGILILACALMAGAGLYYLQIYGFYRTVSPKHGADVELVTLDSGQSESIVYDDFQAIDADSSPIRYRACFTTTLSSAELAATYVTLKNMTPRNGPNWFDCFDARAIGEALQAGTAQSYLGTKNVSYGVDRIVAILDDGRGFVWHELNECGEKAYDGTVVGEECPPRDAANGG